MKNMIFASLLVFNLSCDNSTEADSAFYGKWVHIKSVITTTGIGEPEVEESTYDPSSDQYKSASLLELKKNRFITYEDDPNGDYMMDVNDIPPKTFLDYEFESGQLVINSSTTFGDILIENRNYYRRYSGDIPPESWLK